MRILIHELPPLMEVGIKMNDHALKQCSAIEGSGVRMILEALKAVTLT